MAKQIIHSSGFLILEMSDQEIMQIGPGFCDSCIEKPTTGFYIAVLNSYYCKTCFQEWQTRAIRYEEDLSFELKMYNRMVKRFELKEQRDCEKGP